MAPTSAPNKGAFANCHTTSSMFWARGGSLSQRACPFLYPRRVARFVLRTRRCGNSEVSSSIKFRLSVLVTKMLYPFEAALIHVCYHANSYRCCPPSVSPVVNGFFWSKALRAVTATPIPSCLTAVSWLFTYAYLHTSFSTRART